jgi:hypothetical protein
MKMTEIKRRNLKKTDDLEGKGANGALAKTRKRPFARTAGMPVFGRDNASANR